MPRRSRLASLFFVLCLTACLRHPSDVEPLACAAVDAYEPNDTEGTSADLGELQDDPDSSRSITASLSYLRDVDFYAVHIKDTGFGGDPNITVSVPEGFSVTTTFVCDTGSVIETECLQGEPDQDGCRGTDSITDEIGNVSYTNDVIAASTTDCTGTSDDDGMLYIRVEASSPSKCSYSLTIDVD